MSSARWPAGTLRRALIDAHRLTPLATAPQLARFIGCDPGCARVILRQAGIAVPKGKEQRRRWTGQEKARIIAAAKARVPVSILAEELEVATGTLALAALNIIAELAA